jgi:peroxiredoxin Q/BCP
LSKLQAGDPAPDFTLLDQDGESFSLSSVRGRQALVYFYPKADTPGCTSQACGLRDVLGQIGDTVVIGISPDSPARQKRFRDKYSLGFTLLADEDHSVAEDFDVWKQKSMYGRKYMGIERSAFLIGADGTIEQAWYKISPKDTPTKLLQALTP